MFLFVFLSTIHPQLTLSPPWRLQALFYTKNKETYVSAFNSIMEQKMVSKLAELWNPSSMYN